MAHEPDNAERELLGRLATRVAGEFGHLLARIGEHLERIDEIAGDRAEVQDELADGHELLARGAALTRQLAAFEGHGSLNPERRDLRVQAGRWWPRLQRAIGHERPLELHLRGAPAALIDDERLALALENLCVNAGEASPPGAAVQLHVDVVDVEGRAWAVIEIVDHGGGMAAELQARAIEPFFTTKPRRAGLGLPAAQAIVEAHGGDVELRSAPGQGTTVTLRLPGAGPEPDDSSPNPEAGAIVRVLLIDAERLITRWMRRSLASKGCEVRTAAGVLAAREQLRHGWAELLIVDRQLPDADGRMLAIELATEQPARPVLFATTPSQLRRDQDRGLAPLPRQVEILTKPFSTRRFDELLSRVLTRVRAERH